MKTLAELRTGYANSPKMLAAVNKAIAENGENAVAMIINGLPSVRPNSSCARMARYYGWQNFAVYAGARAGKYKTEGYRNVVVKLD